MGLLFILSGPSCAGKSPLYRALQKFYPELVAPLRKVVLYTDRAPRPAEVEGVDYFFRPRAEIERLAARPGFVVMDVRGDRQAVDLEALKGQLAQGGAFYEGNPFISERLIEGLSALGAPVSSVFLSPLSREEILYLRAPERRVSLESFVTEVMRRKLLRRVSRQKGALSLADLQNIEARASSALGEMRHAHRFDWVVPNHDGEDSENWDQFYYPLGDARRALLAVADLLGGRVPSGGEKWGPELLG